MTHPGPLLKLDHRWSRRRLSAFVDDELSARRRRRLERHAEACPECRRMLRTLAALLLELHSLRSSSTSSVARGVVARIRDEADQAGTASEG